MNHARFLFVALLGLIPSAHTLEQSAGSRTAQADAGMEIRLQANTALLKAAFDRLARCNTDLKFYKPDAPNADANGCAAPPAPPASGARLVHIGDLASSNRTPSAWMAADICTMSLIGFSTTRDNHGHTCSIERSGGNWRINSDNGGHGSVWSTCYMACYRLQ